MADAKFAALERAHALGALSDDLYETARARLLEEIAAAPLENTFELHTQYVIALVALPDNQHALSASRDNTVKLFNVNDGTVMRTFTHHRNCVKSLALLPDGLRFVSGSHDETACIVEHGLAPLAE